MSILLPLRHQNIVSLLGYCLNPFCMILEFAPQGALDGILANYKRAGVRLSAYVMQKCIVQVCIFGISLLVNSLGDAYTWRGIKRSAVQACVF